MNFKKSKSISRSIEAYACFCSCSCTCSCNCITCNCPGAQPPNPPQYGNHHLSDNSNTSAYSHTPNSSSLTTRLQVINR